MPLTNLTWKLEGDNSMSGKPCAPEVGYGKSQGGQGYLRLKPYCFNPNSVGRNGPLESPSYTPAMSLVYLRK